MEERIGQYLIAEKQPRDPARKTDRWTIRGNSGDTLGSVAWFGRWRQYTFDPSPHTTFNKACLVDLAGFLEKVNREHRLLKTNPIHPVNPCEVSS